MSNSLYRYGYRWQPKPKPVVPDDPTEPDVPIDAPGGRGRRDTVSSRAASIGKGKGKGKGQNKPPPSPKQDNKLPRTLRRSKRHNVQDAPDITAESTAAIAISKG